MEYFNALWPVALIALWTVAYIAAIVHEGRKRARRCGGIIKGIMPLKPMSNDFFLRKEVVERYTPKSMDFLNEKKVAIDGNKQAKIVIHVDAKSLANQMNINALNWIENGK